MIYKNYTKKEFAEDISNGCEIEFRYKNIAYFIGGFHHCAYIDESETGKRICSYPSREELAEKGHIGENRLQDIFDELEFIDIS